MINEYFGTFIAIIILVSIIGSAIRSIIKDKKKGVCHCGCPGCTAKKCHCTNKLSFKS